ncbi:MAG: pilus (MSHA type) biogenesis protein MshL [Formivibrio sp.]|nr:pilus (MSHA type) biogenesis protein MshL [Formivibrio sp.]
MESVQLFCRLLLLIPFLGGCSSAPAPLQQASQHLSLPASSDNRIPDPVALLPEPSKPAPTPHTDTFSVVVSNLAVKDLLFALARDAKINLDIHPDVSGNVTLSAINQTLPQILNRIVQQVDIRWALEEGTLSVKPDTPYLKTYRVDYFNIARNTKSTVNIVNSVATSGSDSPYGSSNSSNTAIESEIQHQFWKRLETNLKELLDIRPDNSPPVINTAQQAGQIARPAMSTGDMASALVIADRLAKIEKTVAQSEKTTAETMALQSKQASIAGRRPEPPEKNLVIIHPETGTLTIRASHRLQQKVAEFLSFIQAAAQRQVMIEATVVEVTLSDQYQSGVDWARAAAGGYWSAAQALSAAQFSSSALGLVSYDNGTFGITLKFLEQFGRTRVLSSPKVMALNNQTAVMKVVDEQVYFRLKIEEDKNDSGEVTSRTYTSELHTVPVGLVMQVTPQISESGTILLNVRPTITNISSYVEDPAVAIVSATGNLGVKSLVPNLQVREFDTTLKIPSGQIAVLGGLIQDSQSNERNGLPGLSRLPFLGDLFSYRDDKVKKIELVIFLKPIVIRQNGLESELANFRPLIPDQHFFDSPQDQELSAFHSGNLPLPSRSQP